MSGERRDRAWFVIAVAGLHAVLCGCSSDGGGGAEDGGTSQPPTEFPFGVPDGAAASATIGAAGGVLDSADGRLHLTVGPGALSEDTTIEIQPITNTAPGGQGTAYRLSPADTTFAEPVQLAFDFTEADVQVSAPDALRIGFQDDEGLWWAATDVQRDDSAMAITVSTTHFSDWSMLGGLQLRPAEATVHQGDTIALTAVDCEPEQVGDELLTLLARCSIDEELPPLPGFIQEWAVDGVPGGTDAAGFVTAGDRPDRAIYTAPDFAVGIERHTVSARIRRRNGEVVLLVSNITVIGAFSFEVSGFYSGESYAACQLVLSDISDRVDVVLAPDDAGIYNVQELTNATTMFTLGSLPPLDPGTLRLDTAPELLTVSDASVVQVQGTDAFGVTLTGTYRSGGCTYIVDDEEVPFPSMSMDGGVGLTFRIADFIDGSQVVIDDDWAWTITQIR